MKPPLLLILIAWAVGSFSEQGTPLLVRSRATTGPCHVGQGVEVEVEIGGEAVEGRPTFEAPRIPGAEIVALDPIPGRAVGRFVVVPRKAGSLEIPAFRARLGDRAGASRPIKLSVAAIPSAGRTSSFLGGVGPFELRGEAEPTSVKAGQAFEYRITMTGPAAWGSDQTPDLSRWSSKAPEFRVEPLPATLTATDPPTRTFRYRLRPLKGGQAVLPPVVIAAFDPSSKTFATRSSTRVAVEVAALRPFDPATLAYGDHPEAETNSKVTRALTVLGLGILPVILVAVGWSIWRRSRARKRRDPGRLALELARDLDPTWSEPEAARRITEGFASLLRRVRGRTFGVLTPPEALEAIERLTNDHELAQGVRRLIERCDRVSYGGETTVEASLIAEAKAVLTQLARRPIREVRGRPPGP